MGSILAPVLASIVIAYFLQGGIRLLQRWRCPRMISYLSVYILFLALFMASFILLLPLVWKQFVNLFNDLPGMLQQGKGTLLQLMQQYPDYFSQEQMNIIIANLMPNIQSWGKTVLTASLSSIPGVIAWIIYLVLVPLLVFFFLKDSTKLIEWFGRFLPRERSLLKQVWSEMDTQLGNYIRGKVTEIIVVGVCTYLVFLYYGLSYSVLLASLVGLSVVIPYVGAVVVTIPVVLVAFIQWGWTPEFAYLFIAYLVVQGLDGNLLVPLLFSEAVNLHPVAIVLAILVFGAMWGFWGVFFSIPLATLIKAVLNAWPTRYKHEC